MSERDGAPPASILAQHALELQAEYATCDSQDERRVIRGELHAVEAQLSHAERQKESLGRLPDFWEVTFAPVTGYLALVSGHRSGRRLEHLQARYFPYPDAIADAMHWVARQERQRAEVYNCAHLVTERRRRKETAAPLAALWVDLDTGPLDTEVVPPPSMIVESSPGRSQCWWRLTSPVEPAVGEELNRRLALASGADKSGWDLTQLLRVPGTRNHKYPDAPLVRVVVDTDRQYDVRDLTHRLSTLPSGATDDRPATRRPHRSGTKPALTAESDFADKLSVAAQQIWRGEGARVTADGRIDRSASLVRIARVLAGAGLSREAIMAALAERDVTLGWRKYIDRADAVRQYEAIADLVARIDVPTTRRSVPHTPSPPAAQAPNKPGR